jgi:Undecaprenyl-phosphate galactose phosphotransferase WbaP
MSLLTRNESSTEQMRILEVQPQRSQAANHAANARSWTSYFWSLVLTGIPLCLTDIAVILACSWLMGMVVAYLAGGINTSTFPLLLAGLSITCPAMFYIYGLYPGIGLNTADELRRISKASLMLALIYFVATTAQGLQPGSNTLIIVLSLPCWLAVLPFARYLMRQHLVRYSWWGLKTIVLGSSPGIAATVHNKLRRNGHNGLRAVGFVDDLHSLNGARAIASEGEVQHAIIAMPDASLQDVMRFLANADHGFPQITILPSVDESFDLGLQTMDIGNHTLGLVGQQRLLYPSNRWLKRMFDVVAVIVGGLFVLPLVAAIAVAIKLTARGPVFYKHQRIGRHGKTFFAWKFRSMFPDADKLLVDYLKEHPELREEWERTMKLKNDPRVTPVGRILRRTSLDELPQLWNVLRGEMSLVGPRPIVRDEVAMYADIFDLYQKVLPGITGIWQVSGRNDTTYASRLMLDASYVRNWSIWLDLCILAKTIVVVVRRDGAY